MRIFNKVAILLGVFAVFPAFGATNACAVDKPNIVFIISDDHDNEHNPSDDLNINAPAQRSYRVVE